MAALYNRYIRGSDGGYTRVAPPRDPPPPGRAPEMDLLNRLLARLHLGDLDSGDLLTLLLLFLLFREGADEELLIALGLLLIL